MFSPPPEPIPTATPNSYITYNFPLPQPPQKHYVGILACQRDPLLTTLDTEVIKCEKRRVEASAPPAGGKGKKAKSLPAKEEEKVEEWEIELLDTVLFPEGGGQPSDQGSLYPLTPEGSPVADAKPINVRQVLRRNLDAIHYVDAPLEVGSRVRAVVDIEGRLDKMTQHTGQHLLSGVIDAMLQLDTLAWSLTAAPTPCYVELPRAPTADEIERIQKRCNEIIAAGAAVQVDVKLGAEKPSSVPADYKGTDGHEGVLRTVEIVGLNDRNPCCGTHFPNLSYLQSIFILPHTTSVRTNARLHFLVGPRVLSALATSHSIVRSSALELGCAAPDLVDRVAALNGDKNALVKKERRLREEVAGFVAEKLWASSGGGEVRTGLVMRDEDSTNSLEFLSSIGYALKPHLEITPPPPHLFILASHSAPGTTPPSGSLLILGTDDLVMKAGKSVMTKLEGRVKGGGKGRWQGKLTGRFETGDQELLEIILREVVA